jgi:Tfp pilus assembly protein PilW
MRQHLRPRGNSLMITLIALAVLMLLVAAAIQFTGTNREASVAKARADEVQACATTARKLLLGKLRTFGVATGGLTLNTRIPDSPSSADDKLVRTAHIDAPGLEPVIVKLDSSVMGSSRYQARDVANTLASSTLGGEYYRVVVSCRHPSTNAQSEVEFTFRHGL